MKISLLTLKLNSRVNHRFVAISTLAFIGASALAASAVAQTATWDAGAGADTRWNISSAFPNFSGDATPVGKHVIFNNDGAAASGATSTQNMGTISLLSLSFENQGSSNNHNLTLTSSANVTLTAGTGGNVFKVGGFNGSGSSIVTNVTITGAGQLHVNDATSNFLVGNTNSGSGSNSTASLDMSGLTTFSANVDNFIVGGGPRGVGNVRLAKDTTITANSISLSAVANTGVGSGSSTLRLGQANVLNVDTISVGDNKSGTSTMLDFDTGLTAGPTVQIRNKTGTGRAALNVGVVTTNPTSGASGGAVNLSGGIVDALLSNVIVGQGATSNTAAVTGSFSFANGTVDATNVLVGESRTSSTTTNTVTGSFSMNGGTFLAGTVTAGKNTSGGQNVAGSLNISGGVATIGTLVLADKGGSAASVTGTLNFSGGALNVETLRKGAGDGSAIVNWTGGTLNVEETGLSLVNNGTGILNSGGAGVVGTTSILSGAVGVTYTQGATATLGIDLASNISFDLLDFTGGAVFLADGTTLAINIIGSYVPVIGTFYDVVLADSITLGGSLNLTGGQFNYELVNGDTLRIIAVPEPASVSMIVIGFLGLAIIMRNRCQKNRSTKA